MEIPPHQIDLTGDLTDTHRLTAPTKKEAKAKDLLRYYSDEITPDDEDEPAEIED